MRVDGNSLWIGSPQGVWHWSEGAQSPQARSGGLTSSNSQQVWDFAFRSATQIYIATFEGIYRGDGTGAWQPFGLQDKQFYSLAFVGNYLYAGARRPSDQASVEAGVWRRSLRSGDWERVTSANWNTTYIVRELRYDATCQGLVAATNDGVWLLK